MLGGQFAYCSKSFLTSSGKRLRASAAARNLVCTKRAWKAVEGKWLSQKGGGCVC
eukprot:SM000263S09810  [mRNA]  locus=s263:167141:167757:+ [translate_table: standard]